MMKDKIDAFVCALRARGCSSPTIETYRWRLTQLREATGKPTLAISAEDLGQYIVDLWARNLSPVRVAARIQSIKTYFKWCVERSYLDRSPAMHLKKPKLERLCSDAMEEENLQLLLPFFVCSHTISMSLLQTCGGKVRES
jgi:site-specific recombinase XerD